VPILVKRKAGILYARIQIVSKYETGLAKSIFEFFYFQILKLKILIFEL